MNEAALTQKSRRFKAHAGWHVLGTVMVLAWLWVMALVFWPRTALLSTLELDYSQLDGTLVENQMWLGAYQNDRKLGYVHAVVERADSGYAISQDSHMLVTLAGLKQPVRSRMKLHLGSSYTLQSFDFKLKAGPISLDAAGQMTARGLDVAVNVGGQKSKRILPLREAPVFDLALPYLLARQSLEPGDRFKVRLFDPQTLSNGLSELEVVGAEALPLAGKLVPALHISRNLSGVRTDSWIDSSGRLMKQEVQGGLVLVRETEHIAKSGLDGYDPDSTDAGWLKQLIPERGAGGSVTP